MRTLRRFLHDVGALVRSRTPDGDLNNELDAFLDASVAPTVFTKNRDRLPQHAVAHSFFQRVIARAADLMSDEHFTVDGTQLEAWASQKSFQRKDGDTDGDPTPGCIGSRTTRRRAWRIWATC